jgi:hypothetical protein
MGQYYRPVSIEKSENVYSHDYKMGMKLMEHSWVPNEFVRAVESLIAEGGRWFGDRIVWAGDYADKEKDENGEVTNQNLYDICQTTIKPDIPKKPFRYLVNLDTKEYVDKVRIPDKDGWRIHPLPLLTCEGNGRGGGDYHRENPLVGKWARNRIIAQHTKPKGCKEILFTLTE